MLCWLGDSRAYWLAAEPADAQQLTRDDSLAQEMVSLGLLPAEEALESPQAHVVTRWVGADPAEARPHVTRFEPPGAGAVLLCSDGLWNYLPEAAGLSGLAMPAPRYGSARLGQGAVQFAIDAGGRDNITGALIRSRPARPRSCPGRFPEQRPVRFPGRLPGRFPGRLPDGSAGRPQAEPEA